MDIVTFISDAFASRASWTTGPSTPEAEKPTPPRVLRVADGGEHHGVLAPRGMS